MKKHPFLLYLLAFPVFFIVVPAAISLFFPHNIESIATSSVFSRNVAPSGIKIAVLNTESGSVHNTDLEEYLVGVLAAEMPASYEMEALKAQAVAARSFIMSRLSNRSQDHKDADVCSDPNHCKAWLSEKDYREKWPLEDRDFYHSKLVNAVNSTRGEYMVYGEEIVEAFFFAGSGGRTESSEDVWGGERPYLKSVESEGDIFSPDYKSEVTVSTEKFWDTLIGFNSQTQPNLGTPFIGNISRTEGGSVSMVSIGGQNFTGVELRHLFGLKSANFTISPAANSVTFNVLGYGHGVGMSQFGANYMAKNGENYTEILSHYYTNIQIIKN